MQKKTFVKESYVAIFHTEKTMVSGGFSNQSSDSSGQLFEIWSITFLGPREYIGSLYIPLVIYQFALENNGPKSWLISFMMIYRTWEWGFSIWCVYIYTVCTQIRRTPLGIPYGCCHWRKWRVVSRKWRWYYHLWLTVCHGISPCY